MKRLSRPALFAFAALIFDAGWAWFALGASTMSNEASTVEMSGTLVWIFLHLPAALLASLPYLGVPADQPLPLGQLFLMGALGLAWAAGLGWALGWWLSQAPKKA